MASSPTLVVSRIRRDERRTKSKVSRQRNNIGAYTTISFIGEESKSSTRKFYRSTGKQVCLSACSFFFFSDVAFTTQSPSLLHLHPFGNIQMGQVNERSLSTLIGTRLFFSLFGHVGHIARNNLKFAFAEHVSPICKYIIFKHFSLKQIHPREWRTKLRGANVIKILYRRWYFEIGNLSSPTTPPGWIPKLRSKFSWGGRG